MKKISKFILTGALCATTMFSFTACGIEDLLEGVFGLFGGDNKDSGIFAAKYEEISSQDLQKILEKLSTDNVADQLMRNNKGLTLTMEDNEGNEKMKGVYTFVYSEDFTSFEALTEYTSEETLGGEVFESETNYMYDNGTTMYIYESRTGKTETNESDGITYQKSMISGQIPSIANQISNFENDSDTSVTYLMDNEKDGYYKIKIRAKDYDGDEAEMIWVYNDAYELIAFSAYEKDNEEGEVETVKMTVTEYKGKITVPEVFETSENKTDNKA